MYVWMGGICEWAKLKMTSLFTWSIYLFRWQTPIEQIWQIMSPRSIMVDQLFYKKGTFQSITFHGKASIVSSCNAETNLAMFQ